MTTRNFLRLSLAAPVLVPLLLLPLAWVHPLPRPIASLVGVLWYALAIGGIPYLFFALLLFGHLDDADERAWRRVSWLAPLLYLPLLCAGVFLGSLAMAGTTFGGLLAGMAYFAAWGLGVGYFYVLLVHAVRLVLARARLVRDETAPAAA